MRLLKSSIITTAVAAVSAIPAFAHAGPHDASMMANIIHWLTSPSHAAFAVIGSLAVVALIVKLKRT